MSNFDPQNADPRSVEAELFCVIESPRFQFERGGETTDRLLNDYFDPEGGILKADCVPNEAGISSMEEAIEEARKGYTVAIKIHHRRAGILAKAPTF